MKFCIYLADIRLPWSSYSLVGDKMAWGDYPAEYNPKVHGPYDPARYYGKGL